MWNITGKNTPSPSPNPDGESSGAGGDNPVTQVIDIVNAIISWAIANPVPVGIVVAIAASIYGWGQLRTYMLQRRGVNLPPLGDIISRTLTYMFKEDTQPVILKPKALARRMVWLTGRRQTIIALIAVTALWVLGFKGWAIILAVVVGTSVYRRTRRVFQYRNAVTMTMFQVANAEFKYGKGSELNARAYCRVTKWNDIYFPDETIVIVPSGYQSEEPRNRERFEINWTGSVTDQHGWTYEWESAKGRVTCRPTPKLPASANHPGPQPHDWNVFPMGVTYGEKEALWDVSVAPHILLCGPTGTGKSVQQRNILLHALTHPQWRVIGLDPKKVELASLRDPNTPTGLKPQVLRVTTTLEDMVEALQQAEDEMNRRYAEMEKIGINHFTNLPEPLPALLVMIDETFALLSLEKIKSDEGKERDALHARAATLIGSIARLGRASGVHLCLATQRPDASVLSGELKNNLDARIACGRMDTTPSLMVLDSDAATRLPLIKGRGILRNGGEFYEYQGYFCPPDRFDSYVEQGREMYAVLAEVESGGEPQRDESAGGKKKGKKGKKESPAGGYGFLPTEDRLFGKDRGKSGAVPSGDLFADEPRPGRTAGRPTPPTGVSLFDDDDDDPFPSPSNSGGGLFDDDDDPFASPSNSGGGLFDDDDDPFGPPPSGSPQPSRRATGDPESTAPLAPSPPLPKTVSPAPPPTPEVPIDENALWSKYQDEEDDWLTGVPGRTNEQPPAPATPPATTGVAPAVVSPPPPRTPEPRPIKPPQAPLPPAPASIPAGQRPAAPAAPNPPLRVPAGGPAATRQPLPPRPPVTPPRPAQQAPSAPVDKRVSSTPRDWEKCDACGGKINPITHECRCSN